MFRRYLPLDLVDELVINADIGHRTGESTRCGADRRPEQRDEEEEAEQHPPKGAAERSRSSQVVQLPRLGLLLADLSGDDGRILDIDELLLLEVLERFDCLVGAADIVERPRGQRSHAVPFTRVSSYLSPATSDRWTMDGCWEAARYDW